MRGVAILSVCAFHWGIGRGGYIGVDMFFVLSGFIITLLLIRGRPSYPSFIGGRVRRLYPPLLGLLALGLLFVWVLPNGPIGIHDAARHALVAGAQLSSPWMATGKSLLDPFGVTWSLSIEWYFYLLWPLIVITLRKRAPTRAARITLVAAGIFYAAALPLPGFHFYFGPTARWAELLVGASIAFWKSGNPSLNRWKAHRPYAVVAVLFIVIWTLGGSDVFHPTYRLVALPLAVASTALLIVGGFGDPNSRVSRMLSSRVLTSVGLISYSLYLWHTFPIFLLKNGWMDLPHPLVGLLGVGLAGLLSFASYIALERPFSRSRRRNGSVDRRVGRDPNDDVPTDVLR